MEILENNSWTDEFYRLAAFIYNEPQHLLLKKNGKGNMHIYRGAISKWCSTERDKIFTGPNHVACLAHYLRTTPVSNPEHLALIEPVLNQLQVGWTTWQMVGQALHEEVTLLRQSEASESREVLENLLNDFVQELGRAGLWRAD